MAWRLKWICWLAGTICLLICVDYAIWCNSDPFVKVPAGEYQVAGMKEPLPEVNLLVTRYSPGYKFYFEYANMLLSFGIFFIAATANFKQEAQAK